MSKRQRTTSEGQSRTLLSWFSRGSSAPKVSSVEDVIADEIEIFSSSQDDGYRISSSVHDELTCPCCDSRLDGLDTEAIAVHVNTCLDRKHTGEQLPPKVQLNPRPAQPQPDFVRPTAFTALMAGKNEDQAWKNASVSESLRSVRAALRPCPFYKIMPDIPFAVDAFRYGRVEGISAYFLSHFHSDHYTGLHKNWDHGKIYASRVTAALVKQQLQVSSEWIVELPIDQAVEVDGVTVTLIDANHCPGSVLFLFEYKVGDKKHVILHCGDFRASPRQTNHPALHRKFVDSIYLDTTYLNPRYAFPSQSHVISAVAALCKSLAIEDPELAAKDPVVRSRAQSGIETYFAKDEGSAMASSRGRLLVVVGTYSIGKERIVKAIAKALCSKVYANPYKRRICARLEDTELDAMLTTDPHAAQVHMTSLMEIRAETLQSYLAEFNGTFTRCVGFRPTGWTFTPPKSRNTRDPDVMTIVDDWRSELTALDIRPQRGTNSTTMCYGVPYSEHSSFRDLTCFCMSINYGRIVPTVNVHSASSRDKMKALMARWQAEKRKRHKCMHFVPDDDNWVLA